MLKKIGLVFISFLVFLSGCDSSVDKDFLLSSAVAAGDYLKNEVNEEGKFTYLYEPETVSIPSKYNILRHSGTLYSMIEVYEFTEDEDLLNSIKRAFTYLTDKIEPCFDLENASCVVEKNYVKVGGNALAILAMVKYAEVTGDISYLDIAESLAEWLYLIQDENGSFSVHKRNNETGEDDDFVSEYYPGEAIFALSKLYGVTKNEKWLRVAAENADYLINDRDKNAKISWLNHDHWLLYGLNELYRHGPNEIYIEHSQKIVQSILQKQRQIDCEQKGWCGSYYTPPRSTPTATRTEGLIAAYKLIKDYGDQQMLPEILKAIDLGIQFQMKCQFDEDLSADFYDPERINGAFYKGPEDYEIRIDYVQHNISGLLGYYRILN